MNENIAGKYEIVDITLLQPNDYNPKPDCESTPELKTEFERIKKSVKRHKQIVPVIVRINEEEKLEIIDGFSSSFIRLS